MKKETIFIGLFLALIIFISACTYQGKVITRYTPSTSGSSLTNGTNRLDVFTYGSGAGKINGPGINCPGDCVESYDNGTNVTFTANASSGSFFTGWYGGCSGTGPCCSGTGTCKIVMYNSTLLGAKFDSSPLNNTFKLDVFIEGNAPGNVTGPGIDCGLNSDCTERYIKGTLI